MWDVCSNRFVLNSVYILLPICKVCRNILWQCQNITLTEQMYQRLTHGEQTVLRDCTPMLVDSIDPDIILPYLMRHGVTTRDDEEFLLFPNQTTKQRNHRIMQCVLYRSPRLAKFLACLQESASEHSLRSHEDLAEVLRAKLHKLGRYYTKYVIGLLSV